MKTSTFITITAALLFILFSCGDKKGYHADITVDGLGTQSVTVLAITPGGIRQIKTPAIDSAFAVDGTGTGSEVVEVYSNTGTLIGRFIASAGDKSTIHFDINNPAIMTARGSDDSSQLFEFLQKNNPSDTVAFRNAIEAQVEKEPSSLLSASLLAFYYPADDNENPARLARLFAAPQGDYAGYVAGRRLTYAQLAEAQDSVPPLRAVTYGDDTLSVTAPAPHGQTLYYFYNSTDIYTDTIGETLTDKRFAKTDIVTVRLMNDTFRWNAYRRLFPDRARHIWLPAGTADSTVRSIRLRHLPVFALTDSTGRFINITDDISKIK